MAADRIHEALANGPQLPSELVEHIELCLKEAPNNRLVRALIEHPEETVKALHRLIRRAANVLGCSESEALRRADFNKHDLDQSKFDAVLAELRGVVYLKDEGFQSIRLFKADRQVRRADGSAIWKGERVIFDVVCSTEDASNSRRQLARHIASKYGEKHEQLSSNTPRDKAQLSLLICVLNTSSVKWDHGHRELLVCLKEAFRLAESPPDTHFAVVTGDQMLGQEPDDCVYPELN